MAAVITRVQAATYVRFKTLCLFLDLDSARIVIQPWLNGYRNSVIGRVEYPVLRLQRPYQKSYSYEIPYSFFNQDNVPLQYIAS